MSVPRRSRGCPLNPSPARECRAQGYALRRREWGEAAASCRPRRCRRHPKETAVFHSSTYLRRLRAWASAALLFVLTAPAAFAGTNMPWDTPIQTLEHDLTGPFATGVSVIAFVAAGVALIFGEEISGIIKKLLTIVVAISIIVFGNNILNLLGLIHTGAVVAAVTRHLPVHMAVVRHGVMGLRRG